MRLDTISSWSVALALLGAEVRALSPAQITLGNIRQDVAQQGNDASVHSKRKLHGRFLHITDFHVDPFYKLYSSIGESCHREDGRAGIYGAEMSDCDSPVALVNKTMEWVAEQYRHSVDFVIWTGDSARHDNDDDIPRNEEQVLGLNRFMVRKMAEAFGKRDNDQVDDDPNNDFIIPIVPSIGNNDILPHNIFTPGPNKWSRNYANLWRQFIPEEQRHSFEQGGWFYVEVIPRKLAVFSLNTLYFFSSNAAADGCALPDEPGYRQLEWLRIQLQFLRDRGMKAILIGHVGPVRQPSKTAWEESCWQKYTLWLRQYRDIIVSSHYGHFNYDHMILQDFEELRKETKKGKMPDFDEPEFSDGQVHATVSSKYFIDLRDAWGSIPELPKSLRLLQLDEQSSGLDCRSRSIWCQLRTLVASIFKKKKKSKADKKLKHYYDEIGGEFAERYAASFVSASVVPNLFPTLRVFEYNITGLSDAELYDSPYSNSNVAELALIKAGETELALKKSKHKNKRKKEETKKYKFVVPKAPSKSAPPGPAYSPQTFSLLRYRQYFANLTRINNDIDIASERMQEDEFVDEDLRTDRQLLARKPHPKKFEFESHYNTHDDDVYKLENLAMPNLIDLARRIGNFEPETSKRKELAFSNQFDRAEEEIAKDKDEKKKRKQESDRAWYTFVRRAYVETLSDEEIRDEFGSR